MAVNLTLNKTIAALPTEEALTVWNLTYSRFMELITAPYHHKDMIWIVLPLVTALFLMQLYFGRYKKEELGWNTAVGNSLALIFVAVDLTRQIYLNSASTTVFNFIFDNFSKVMIVFILGIVSFWLLFGEFFHLFPKKFAFLISSSLPTTLIAYLAIILIYTKIPIDFSILLASLMMFIVLTILFKIIHMLEPAFRERIRLNK